MSDTQNELYKFETNPKYREKVIGRIHKEQDNEYQKRLSRLQKEKVGLVNGRTREIQRIEASRWQPIANTNVKVNRTEGLVRINNSDVKFSSIKGAEMNIQMGARIVTHETSQAKSKKHASLGGAVVGGMVFGPVGALVGGTSMGKTTTKGKSTSYSDQIPTCVHMGVMVNVDGFASEIVLISSQVDQSSLTFSQAQSKAQAIISQLAQLANTPVPEHFLQPCEENSVKLIDQQIDAKEEEIRNATADRPTYALPDMYRDPNFAEMTDTQYLARLKEDDSKGHEYDLKSNVIEKLTMVFHDSKPSDNDEYIIIVGRADNERVNKYIKRCYVNDVVNLDKYKVFIPKASGVGEFGETLGPSIIASPGMGHTETFFSIGHFDSEVGAENLLKYLKGKFARTLLSVLKTTQNITPGNFKYIPLQNFTHSSDIDWSCSIADIDKQLYAKYGLSPEEIDFIETHVKEMA